MGRRGGSQDTPPDDAGSTADAPASTGPADASSEGSGPSGDASSGDAAGAIDSGSSGEAGSCTSVTKVDLLGGCAANGFSSFSWTCGGASYSIVFSIIGGANGSCHKQNAVYVPSGAGPSPFSSCQKNQTDAIAIATSYCGFPSPAP